MSKLMRVLFGRLQDGEPDGAAGGGAAAEPAAETSAVNWEDMSGPDDLGVDDEVDAAEPEEAPAAEAETPVEEEVPAGETAQEEETTPEETPAAEEAAVVEEAPQLTPEQLAQREKDAAEWMKQRETHLTEYYKLDEDSAAKMVTEPEVVLPQLAARLHMQVETAVRQQVQTLLETQLPGLMKTVQTREVANQKAQEEFFAEWPELKGFEDQVLEVGQMFRKKNPKADAKTAIAQIGRTTMAMLGLERKATVQAQVTPAKPFKPAGGSGSTSTPVKSDNKWDGLLDD